MFTAVVILFCRYTCTESEGRVSFGRGPEIGKFSCMHKSRFPIERVFVSGSIQIEFYFISCFLSASARGEFDLRGGKITFLLSMPTHFNRLVLCLEIITLRIELPALWSVFVHSKALFLISLSKKAIRCRTTCGWLILNVSCR